MKNICFIVLLSIALCGCLKNKDFQEDGFNDFHNMSCSENPQEDILGKWELVSLYADGVEVDRVPGTIIYEFKNSGIVVISNDTDPFNLYPIEYSYHFAENPSDPGSLCVVIDKTYYNCCISNKLMSLDYMYNPEHNIVMHNHFKKL